MLQQQHMAISITYEIILSLQEMFGDKGKLPLSTMDNKGTPIEIIWFVWLHYLIGGDLWS